MSAPSPSMATSPPCQVFISYASKDADRVVPLAQLLEQSGVSVWRDGDRILGGQYYGEQIVHALAHSRVVLLVCSPQSLASDNVHREVLLTWDYYHRRYVPVWIAQPGEIPERFRYCLAGCQWIDAHAEPPERWLAQLLSALRALGVVAAGDRETAPPPLSTGRGAGAGGQGPHFKPGDRPIAGADWELLSLLGKGGFGEVWKAHNPDLPSQPPVALKFCLRLDERGRQLLRHEADMVLRVQQQVRNEGVVPLVHAYLNNEPPCLEYPYVDGGTLVEFLDQTRQVGASLAPAQVERVLCRIAQVVAAAHRATPKLVHRDLKPANVLLERRPGGKRLLRVTDFGIGAIIAQPQLEQARTGSSLQGNMASVLTGSYTPLYASPQQIRGDKPDPRDDVYALGVIWYQLLTGDLASPAPTGRRWTEPLRHRGVSEAAIDLLASCFESDPAYRPADAGVLAEGLVRLGQAGVAKGDALDEFPMVEPAAGAPRAEKQPAAPSTKTRLRAVETVPAGGRLPPAMRLGRDEPAAILRVKKAGATPPRPPKQKRLILAGVAAGVLLIGLVGLWAGGVFKGRTTGGAVVPDKPAADGDGPQDNGPPPKSEDFVRLFNGKDLTGWMVEGGDAKAWGVADGEIIAWGDDPKTRSYLLTDRAYADFRLRLEFNLSRGAGSGVALRALRGEKMFNGQPIIDHPLFKLIDGRGNAETGTTHWVLHAIVVAPSQSAELQPVGSWNQLEIEVKGHALRAWVNAKPVAQMRLAAGARLADGALPALDRARGRIGLQKHTGMVRFRKIEIKELPAGPAAAATDGPKRRDRFAVGVLEKDAGKWRIADGCLEQTSLTENVWIDFGDTRWGDYDFSVEFLRVQGNAQCCLAFLFDREKKHGGLFGLSSFVNTAHTVAGWGPGKPERIVGRNPGTLPAGTWQRARVSVRSGHVQCFLNDQKLFDFKIDTHLTGCVGLRTWNSYYRFRNIKVTDPHGKVLLEGLPELDGAGFGK